MQTVFGVASIPEREKHLKITLESVLPQADKVHVYLNNYPNNFTTEWLQHDKIFVYRSQQFGDKSDGGKFHNVPEDCYYLSIDDDIWYPPGYADYLKSRVDEFYGQVIVSLHGRRLKGGKQKSYYRGKEFVHHCLRYNPIDRWVHVGGTGVMCFNSNYFRPTPDLFKLPHMADIWIAKLAQEKKMPILALKHESEWIKSQGIKTPTIFDRFKNNDQKQTMVANSVNWVLYQAV